MPEKDYTVINISGSTIGITGLKAVLEEMVAYKGHPDEEIVEEIFQKLKVKNYISSAAAEDYKKAFLREFKKFVGEEVGEEFEEESKGLKIQVAGPGCPRCFATEKNVRDACAQLNLSADISHVYDIKEIAKLGVIMTPAVIVDGKIVVSGKLPTVEELKKLLSGVK